MSYYIRRYLNGIRKVRKWLPLVIVPCMLYAALSALRADRFAITQLMAVDFKSPAAVSRNPLDVVPLKDIAEGREAFFLDDFAIIELSRRLKKETFVREENLEGRELRRLIEETLAMRVADPSHLEIRYYGNDAELGRFMVEFYARKLMARSQEGIARAVRYGKKSALSTQAQSDAVLDKDAPSENFHIRAASMAGEATLREFRVIWRRERMGPFLIILALSLLAMGIAAGAVEWSDPSFKSVRQVARYLNIPVLGVMPDLGDVGAKMAERRL